MKCDICDNCIKKDVCIYRDNSEICGEDYHEFVADLNVLEQIRDEISKTWYTHPKNKYEEGLKDQALIDIQIIDKYR